VLGIILLVLATVLSYGLTQVFSARGAYIHIGAIIGTIMAGNVFFGIIPSQKALVEAVKNGTAPDPAYGLNAKVRSTHNTYTTLPILFIMISNHYPITYNHSYSWLVLVAIIMITAAIRQYFVLRHFGKQKPVILVGAIVAMVALAYAIAPKTAKLPSSAQQQVIDVAKVEQIIRQRCTTCHSATPTDDVFTVAPGGVALDDMQTMSRWASRIKARGVDSKDMPLMNKTNMTEQERQYLALWFAQGAPSQ
jgi:uncharacterized membrane protein